MSDITFIIPNRGGKNIPYVIKPGTGTKINYNSSGQVISSTSFLTARGNGCIKTFWQAATFRERSTRSG